MDNRRETIMGATRRHRGILMPSPTVTIILMLPSKELSPNVHSPGLQYRIRHARRQYRADARLVTQAAMELAGVSGGWRAATVQAVFHFATNRRRDPDNLLASLKSAFDGIVDGGLMVDDNDLTHLPVRQTRTLTDPRVELLFTEARDGEEEKEGEEESGAKQSRTITSRGSR